MESCTVEPPYLIQTNFIITNKKNSKFKATNWSHLFSVIVGIENTIQLYSVYY